MFEVAFDFQIGDFEYSGAGPIDRQKSLLCQRLSGLAEPSTNRPSAAENADEFKRKDWRGPQP